MLYGVTQQGTLGTIGLVSAAVALVFLATINIYVRDSNVSAMDIEAHATAPAARRAPGASLWPFAAGLGATMVTVGVVTFQAITILGLIVLLAGDRRVDGAGLERAGVGGSGRTTPRSANGSPCRWSCRSSLRIGVGVIIYSISRVMLGLPTKDGAVVAFVVVATLVLLVGTLTSVRRKLSTGTIAGVCSVAVIAIVASGAVYGLDGERETHHHETTGAIAEDGDCGAEETEADEDASQTVAAKSSVAATITLTADERLTYTVPGVRRGDGDRSRRCRGRPPTTCCSATSPTNPGVCRSTPGRPARCGDDRRDCHDRSDATTDATRHDRGGCHDRSAGRHGSTHESSAPRSSKRAASSC